MRRELFAITFLYVFISFFLRLTVLSNKCPKEVIVMVAGGCRSMFHMFLILFVIWNGFCT